MCNKELEVDAYMQCCMWMIPVRMSPGLSFNFAILTFYFSEYFSQNQD